MPKYNSVILIEVPALNLCKVIKLSVDNVAVTLLVFALICDFQQVSSSLFS